jgi:hypothetical protein
MAKAESMWLYDSQPLIVQMKETRVPVDSNKFELENRVSGQSGGDKQVFQCKKIMLETLYSPIKQAFYVL